MPTINLTSSELLNLARLCDEESKRPGKLDRRDALARAKRHQRYQDLRTKLIIHIPPLGDPVEKE